jgi:hypothetical protein
LSLTKIGTAQTLLAGGVAIMRHGFGRRQKGIEACPAAPAGSWSKIPASC